MSTIKEDGQIWPDTDLDLNTSPSLPECPTSVGMDFPAELGGMLKSDAFNDEKGYAQTASDVGTDRALEDYPVKSTEVDPRGYPVSGFVRPESFVTMEKMSDQSEAERGQLPKD